MRILLVSTSLGAGHHGVARVMAQRLEERGHATLTVDYLDLLPPGSGTLVKHYYAAQLRYAPWSYERSYHAFEHIHRSFAKVNGLATAWRVRRLRQQFRPDLIVSNNPHASMALGFLRGHEHITEPVMTYVTDFGVHALWVHPSIDATLVLGNIPHAEAIARKARLVRVVRPLVDDRFLNFKRHSHSGPAQRVRALVTAGSWGAGDLRATLTDVSSIPHVDITVVCGKDESLRRQLERATNTHALGWVDDMPALMSQSDVLIENAGGLTSLEAMACGLPVVSYRPLAGHGRHNATNLAASGFSAYARNRDELATALTPPLSSGTSIESWDAAPDSIDIIEALVDS